MSLQDPREREFSYLLRQDIRKWLGRLERFFENNNTAHVVVKTIFAVLGILALLLDSLEVFQASWTKKVFSITLVALLITILVVDYLHVLLAKQRLNTIIQQKKIVKNLERIIRGATDLAIEDYNILGWEVTHDINEEGDVRYSRKMTIAYVGAIVYWVTVPIGVIDGEKEKSSDDLKIEVVNPNDGGQLPYVVIDETDSKKVLAINLNPPATSIRNSSFELRLIWKGAYKLLISDFQDSGKVSVDHETEKIKLTFILPLGLEFVTIRMKKGIGEFRKEELEDGRHMLIWEAKDLKTGSYPYKLICKRKEP